MNDGVQKLGMPKWGLSMTEGRVVEWLVDEGAEVAIGDEVAEVETDKLNGAVESPVAGVLRRRVAGVGDTVAVGGLLGVVAGAEVSDAEIDAFVAEFQASFVPGEADEDAGPAPEVVHVAAGNLRYLRQGDGGDAVLLLHGFGGDLNSWLFAAPALAQGHTVYALELPGHGGSSKDVGPGDVDSLVDAAVQFLDAVDIERVHLVGHSLGGLVAASTALRDPGRALSLTLVASAGLGEEINGDYLDGFISAGSRRELKPALELLFADSGQVTRQVVDDVLKYKRIDGVDAALRSIAEHVFGEGRQHVLVADRLAGLGVPLLVVWGEQDRIIPAEHARHVPEGAEVHVLEGSGHSPHMEAAGDVNRVMERFLASV
ncbi:MAG TPA: acetoin dehydrogenase dihydrolipoyllysine-residue acetyltransferase subunit [Solirubrobacteraceae bacterium]|nr:acetoin dehydrogenase dihydrolipoyllysine-residue acetyltransferase subunit [Solirubrobacteraceae bacterium]